MFLDFLPWFEAFLVLWCSRRLRWAGPRSSACELLNLIQSRCSSVSFPIFGACLRHRQLSSLTSPAQQLECKSKEAESSTPTPQRASEKSRPTESLLLQWQSQTDQAAACGSNIAADSLAGRSSGFELRFLDCGCNCACAERDCYLRTSVSDFGRLPPFDVLGYMVEEDLCCGWPIESSARRAASRSHPASSRALGCSSLGHFSPLMAGFLSDRSSDSSWYSSSQPETLCSLALFASHFRYSFRSTGCSCFESGLSPIILTFIAWLLHSWTSSEKLT